MNEQRPGMSPMAHPAQPLRPSPPPPMQQHGPRVHPVPHAAHAPHAPVAPHAPQSPMAKHAPNTAPLPVDDDLVVLEDDALTLEDDGQTSPPVGGAAPAGGAPIAHEAHTPKKITFNADAIARQRNFKRKPHLSGAGACRVRTFHGKCSDQGLEYLDDAINVFFDEHPDIEIKHITANVAMFDGKFKDFALIVNVWY